MDDAGERANALIRRYVLEQCYRGTRESGTYDPKPGTNAHLLTCPEANVDVSTRFELWYDTGVEAIVFEAVIECPHGEREEYEYGELGELPYLLEDIARDYPDV